jgi:putative oxidoreductase
MKIGRLLLRLAVGGFFFGHGTQKLFGWFGGNGLDATAQGFEALGLRPGKPNAIVAGAAEAGGGALLATGLATPLAASVLTATMLTAIKSVHGKNGPWLNNGGYEYNVVLIGAVLTLVEVDRERSGSRSALGVLLVGVLGAVGAHLAAAAAPAPPAPEAAAAASNGSSAEPAADAGAADALERELGSDS